MITLCYITNRDNPRLEWFIDSFNKQYNNEVPIEILVVDGSERHVKHKQSPTGNNVLPYLLVHPKPTPWQGEYRITKDNWFAASNTRNTGVIYANGSYIVYVDDLSVLTANWWQAVLRAYHNNEIILGAYKKVVGLEVENGNIIDYMETHHGNDHRLQYGSRPAGGSWLYGCSCGFPIEVLLAVNGWDEICDGSGYEDVHLGLRLEKGGFKMVYDTQMLTLECEECHSEGTPFRREDKLLTPEQYAECKRRLGITGTYQKGGRTDMSHLLMDMVYSNRTWTWGNDFILSELKKTKDFKMPTGNELHWPDLQPIKDM